VTESLAERVARFDRDVLARDLDAVIDVIDADYALLLVHPVRAVVPRETWLANLPDYVVHSWDVLDSVVDEDGDTGSVLRSVAMNATVNGQDRTGTFVITDVWRRRAGRWYVWRRHSTPLTAGPMPGA
jgi:ketosteroid isomerase-like protein